ncbi:hypothetical protein PACTADRAFT_14817 [Pachysolen tannophilus NRRL Y-2460]|uniref:Uncharacterized protein n=1 Tax=Pachysolen tannophilus NRRL Y-2460 TaxID=669874 RepID=A0A1E4U2Y1_PACTA|nr:hypothetical protein PACTADRAFT_14817 [Pachysolen tannophilus NRRL Y-2460]
MKMLVRIARMRIRTLGLVVVPRVGFYSTAPAFVNKNPPILLNETSSLNDIRSKTNDLIELLNQTNIKGEYVVKLTRLDYNDLGIIISKLGVGTDRDDLIARLSFALFNTTFDDCGEELLYILVKLIELSPNKQELFSKFVNLLSRFPSVKVDAKLRVTIYRLWSSNLNDELIQKLSEFVEQDNNNKNNNNNNLMLLNLLIYSHTINGDYKKAYKLTTNHLLRGNFFEEKGTLDIFILNLLSYHLLNHKKISPVFKIVQYMERKNYPPLANQILGQLMSLSTKSNYFGISKYCFSQFNSRHYFDNGSLKKLLQLSFTRNDKSLGKKVEKYLMNRNDSHYKRDFNNFKISLLESKWENFNLSKLGNLFENPFYKYKYLKVRDFPNLQKKISKSYNFQNINDNEHERQKLLNAFKIILVDKNSSKMGRLRIIKTISNNTLLFNIFLSCIAELGNVRILFKFIRMMTQETENSLNLDKESIFYILRCYSKSTTPLDKESLKFIENYSINNSKSLEYKDYQLIFKILFNNDTYYFYLFPILESYIAKNYRIDSKLYRKLQQVCLKKNSNIYLKFKPDWI